jgi:hypothetical protein
MNEAISHDTEVLDESFTGLGLLVRHGTAFQRGQRVRLTRQEQEDLATVVHIQACEDGNYYMRLDWTSCEVKRTVRAEDVTA